MVKRKIFNRLKILLILVLSATGLILIFKNFLLPKVPEIFVMEVKPHQPQKIRITNLSDNSFSVSWITQKPTSKSAINYYQKGDQPQTLAEPATLPSSVHQIDIQNLEPQTVYFFTIFSEKEDFKKAGNQPFEVKTLKTTEKPPEPPFILTGSVKDNNGNPQTNALVFFYHEALIPLSVFVNEKGNFLFSLNNARNKTDGNYFSPQDQSAKILVETGRTSYIKTFTISKNLNLIITPTDEVYEEEKLPEAQTAAIQKQTLWQKMKEWLEQVISY